MLRSVQRKAHDAILRRPRRVLAIAVVASAIAAVLALQVEYRSSRSELAPPDDPEQRRFSALLDDFGGSQALVACVEPVAGAEPSPADARAFLDRAAARWRALPEVRSVFHRVDVDWLLRHGLHLAPPATVLEAAAVLSGPDGAAVARALAGGLGGIDEILAERVEAGPGDSPPGPGEDVVAGARGVLAFLRWQRAFVDDPEGTVAGLERDDVLTLLAKTAGRGDRLDGALSTADGRTLFAFLSPVDPDDSLDANRRLLAAVRGVAAEATAEDPRFRIAWTGNPAMTVEEMDAVRRDTWKTGAIAAAGVALLTFLTFRWKSHAVLVLIALAAGVLWSYGAVLVEYGYLNLITSAFLSTLVGVGVAYGIHPMSEYELEGAHAIDAGAAVDRAWGRTGAAVATSAITTAAAFFSVLLMRFRGFAELGLVAGVGVLLCLVSFLTVLPALLVLYGRRRGRRDRSPRTGAAASTVDRLWVERGAAAVCRHPKTVTVVAAVLSVAAAFAASGIGFDTNLLDLLPDDAESVEYQRRMTADADVSPLFNLVTASDLAGLRELRDRAKAEPTIRSFQSVLQFLPEDPVASTEAVGRFASALRGWVVPESAARFDVVRARAAIERVERALTDASDAAFGAGMGDLAGVLEESRAEAEATLAALDPADPDQVRALDASAARLATWTRRALDDLRAAAAIDPPSLERIPAQLRDRFVTRSGRLLGILQPDGQVFDPAFLDAYDDASRRVSLEAAGFPLVFRHMSRRITAGFYRAVAIGAVLVTLILWFDYRDLRSTTLALVPLSIGVLWMLGGMRLLGLSFNFANLVGVPLILGVGIDNGVHLVHRLRLDREAGMESVLRHTGRAILIASMTTMIGFGSLALASHRGLASLGVVLLLGVGACLVTSTVVLPNMLVALGAVRR